LVAAFATVLAAGFGLALFALGRGARVAAGSGAVAGLRGMVLLHRCEGKQYKRFSRFPQQIVHTARACCRRRRSVSQYHLHSGGFLFFRSIHSANSAFMGMHPVLFFQADNSAVNSARRRNFLRKT
jgi:hypothetical protein